MIHYTVKGLNQTNFKGDMVKFLEVALDNLEKVEIDVEKVKGAKESWITVYLANADVRLLFTTDEEPKFKGLSLAVGSTEGETLMLTAPTGLAKFEAILEVHNNYMVAMREEMKDTSSRDRKKAKGEEEPSKKNSVGKGSASLKTGKRNKTGKK